MIAELFDVVAVDLNTLAVRLIGKDKTLRNAEAIVQMAVMRRGCEEEFFVETPAGAHQEGDLWKDAE